VNKRVCLCLIFFLAETVVLPKALSKHSRAPSSRAGGGVASSGWHDVNHPIHRRENFTEGPPKTALTMVRQLNLN